MKKSAIFSFFLMVFIGFILFYLKVPIVPAIGLLLLTIVITAIIINFVVKARQKKLGKKGEPNAFIFPDKVAKGMKKLDIGIQYEASCISSAFLMVGIILFLIYFIFFTESSWVLKGLIIFNSLCGMGLMAGMLVTYYQQLVSYREAIQFLKNASSLQNNNVYNVKGGSN